MITISVVPEQKTYYLKKSENYTINGVKQIQNNSTEDIRISENPIDQKNKGWVLHAGKNMGFTEVTTVYINTLRNKNIELEME